MKHLPDIERKSLKEIRQFQFLKLREAIAFLELNSPFYRRLLTKHKPSAGLESWSEFENLPTTSKDDLQKNNWDFLSVPRNAIREYTSTSGTLGRPVSIALTANDIRRLAYNECLSFACADGNEHDLYQLMVTLDRQFMAGMAYYEGIRQLGAGLIRVGAGLPALQWQTIESLRPTAVVVVPSFLIKLIDYAAQAGLDVNKSGIKKAICIGEPVRRQDLGLNALGKKIIEKWDLKLFSTYASTEMQTAFTECDHGRGGHTHPELIYVEVLDGNNKPVKYGETGEVVITTLGVEGMPLLRYKTGDKASLHDEPCGCGRTTPRIGPIIGRGQHMVKLKGTTLYPPAIFECLHEVPDVKDFVVEVFSDALQMDLLKVRISCDRENERQVFQKLRAAFQSGIKVMPEIVFSPQAEIEQLQTHGGGRKLRKFLDHRLPYE